MIYGGVISFNDRRSTITCIVRNFSPDGAKIEISSHAIIPDHVVLTVMRKGRQFAARVVWRSEHEAGLAFVEAASASVIRFDRSRMRHASSIDGTLS